MVPDEFRHLPEYREVTGTPRKVYGPYWAIVGERRREPRMGAPPHPNPNWVGAGPHFLPPSLPFLPLLIQLGKVGGGESYSR